MFKTIMDVMSLWLLPMIILIILLWAIIKKVPVYEAFVEGAKDGVKVGFNIIPPLVAIIVAVSMFRASGAIDILSQAFGHVLAFLHVPVEVLPIMITRSLSGSATLGLLSDVINSAGVDSYATKLAAVMIGSSETTFYVLAVYFGAVGIRKFRQALLAGIFADVCGIVLAVIICRFIFI